MRTAAKIATLGHFGSKKDDDGAGKTKAQKRQRAVRLPTNCYTPFCGIMQGMHGEGAQVQLISPGASMHAYSWTA